MCLLYTDESKPVLKEAGEPNVQVKGLGSVVKKEEGKRPQMIT